MSENVILIGFMGSGKDEVGKELACKTGKTFVSTDTFIELKEKKAINRIFKESKEGYFRSLEKKAMNAIKNLKNVIVATGGGLVQDRENRRLLTQMGKVIHLDAKLDVIEKRLKYDRNRPLIENKENIRKIFQKRIGLYDFAELRIDTSVNEPARIADEISRILKIKKKDKDVLLKSILMRTPKKYRVQFGFNFLYKYGGLVKSLGLKSKRAAVITNPLIGSLYLQCVENSLRSIGMSSIHIIVPDGEKYKTTETATYIYDFLLENDVTRAEPIVALGGGVIGDLVGFVAATYKRGTPLVQIPTTLLAQVDASIGGKTGIDHKLGKNMIGVFYQPDLVITDTSMLLTLPEREFKNGLAEVIKYGIIKDEDLFSLLETRQKQILKRDVKLLAAIISKCVSIKKRVIEEDEKEEKGTREILNFGHTVGHAVETLTGYAQYSHGEAVVIGMVEEAKIACRNRLLKKRDLDRIMRLITSYGLSIKVPESINIDDIRKMILQDKKIRRGKIRIPILTGIGRVVIKEVGCKKYL
jgi:3-dehydroquinate synthase